MLETRVTRRGPGLPVEGPRWRGWLVLAVLASPAGREAAAKAQAGVFYFPFSALNIRSYGRAQRVSGCCLHPLRGWGDPLHLTFSIRSSFTESAANLRMPSESFSTAIWSSLCSQRKAASSRCSFSRGLAWAGECVWMGECG